MRTQSSASGSTGTTALTRSRSSLPGLKCGTCLPGQRDGVAGLRVAAQAGRTVMQREAAETADLDALAAAERGAHHLEQGLDRQVDVVGLQVALARGEDLDQFGLGHAGSSDAGGDCSVEAGASCLCEGGPNPGRLRGATITRTCCSAARAAAHQAWWCRVEASDALLYSASASAVSASSLALIDSCSVRPLRSMPMNLASTWSPTFRCWVASSTRSLAMSRARHVTFDALAQVDGRALGVHFLDGALDLRALRVGRPCTGRTDPAPAA